MDYVVVGMMDEEFVNVNVNVNVQGQSDVKVNENNVLVNERVCVHIRVGEMAIVWSELVWVFSTTIS
jgi:hypothetical protein